MKNQISTLFPDKKKKYLNALWQQFIKSVEVYYWEEYASAKTSLATNNFKEDVISSKFASNFSLAFQKKVEQHIKYLSDRNLPIPPTGYKSKTGIDGTSLANNFFKINRFSDDVRDSTVTLFCLYLGYDSFDDFKEKNEFALLPPHKKFHLKYPKTLYGIVALIVFFIAGLIFLRTNLPSDEELKLLIKNANIMEYDGYKELSSFDSSKLDNYWTKGIARQRIMNILINHPKKGKVLVDTLNSSGATIVGFDVTLKTRYYIRLQTEEHWHLQWYNTKTRVLDKEYDRVDTQKYELLYQDNRWKIYDNWHIKKPEEIIIR